MTGGLHRNASAPGSAAHRVKQHMAAIGGCFPGLPKNAGGPVFAASGTRKCPNQFQKTTMKTKTIFALLSLTLGAALMPAVRAADITPAETRAIAEEGS
jgi:hypothetical protein